MATTLTIHWLIFKKVVFVKYSWRICYSRNDITYSYIGCHGNSSLAITVCLKMPRNASNQQPLEFWLRFSAASHVQGLASWLDQVNAHVSNLLARNTAFVFKGYFRLLWEFDCFWCQQFFFIIYSLICIVMQNYAVLTSKGLYCLTRGWQRHCQLLFLRLKNIHTLYL